jgi:hypothetical protein
VFDKSDFPFFSTSIPSPDPDLESMFSDPVVQTPVSVFPFSEVLLFHHLLQRL